MRGGPKVTIRHLAAMLAGLVMQAAGAQDRPPIIDMHLHSYNEQSFYRAQDFYGNPGASSVEAHFEETYAALRKHNIIKAVVSGNLASIQAWKARDTDNRLITGLYLETPGDGIDPARFEQLVKTGVVQVFGEIGAYYAGLTLSDEGWRPYLDICERYDIPVAVHTGGGDPGGTYRGSPKARLALGDPFLVEDVLVRYPKLRLYLMHSGESWHEHALRLMAYYPQLYSDLGVMLWVEPLTKRYVADFLRNAKQAGYLDRVMFGSDQMVWPNAIDMSIDYLESLEFLTEPERRAVLHDNAARFLRNSDVARGP